MYLFRRTYENQFKLCFPFGNRCISYESSFRPQRLGFGKQQQGTNTTVTNGQNHENAENVSDAIRNSQKSPNPPAMMPGNNKTAGI